jgi:hypothetical protein
MSVLSKIFGLEPNDEQNYKSHHQSGGFTADKIDFAALVWISIEPNRIPRGFKEGRGTESHFLLSGSSTPRLLFASLEPTVKNGRPLCVLGPTNINLRRRKRK